MAGADTSLAASSSRRFTSPGSARDRRGDAYCTLCGMRALRDHVVKDRYSRPVTICVYDYHPGRVRKALAAQRADTNNASEGGAGAGMWTRMRRSLSTKHPEPPPLPPAATSYVVLGGEDEMSCLVKEIHIPDGLLVANLMCVLCEHAVVLLELSDRRLGAPISGVFYHAI